MNPGAPKAAPNVEFQRVTGVVNGAPVFGNPMVIDLAALETAQTGQAKDGIDNDGNGLVDEHAVRIWENLPPVAQVPGTEDTVTEICRNATKDGLSFTRQGAVLFVDLTLQEGKKGEAPSTFKLASGIKMRNSN
jgi:hypothetical protein